MSWKYFENGLRKKRVLREIPCFGYFIFSKRKGDIISPFLKISPICWKYTWKISVKHKHVKIQFCNIAGPIL
jgi:hypothetical protein